MRMTLSCAGAATGRSAQLQASAAISDWLIFLMDPPPLDRATVQKAEPFGQASWRNGNEEGRPEPLTEKRLVERFWPARVTQTGYPPATSTKLLRTYRRCLHLNSFSVLKQARFPPFAPPAGAVCRPYSGNATLRAASMPSIARRSLGARAPASARNLASSSAPVSVRLGSARSALPSTATTAAALSRLSSATRRTFLRSAATSARVAASFVNCATPAAP